MEAITEALRDQLEQTIERVKGLGGAVAFDDDFGALASSAVAGAPRCRMSCHRTGTQPSGQVCTPG